jgi:hypothetical protein
MRLHILTFLSLLSTVTSCLGSSLGSPGKEQPREGRPGAGQELEGDLLMKKLSPPPK